MKNRAFAWRGAAAMMVTAALAACGDAPTPDTRGYTKAPLETPAVFVRAEEATEMSRLGEPNLPKPVVLLPADTAAGGAAAEPTQP